MIQLLQLCSDSNNIFHIRHDGAVIVTLRNRKVFVSKDDLNIEFSEKSNKKISSNFIDPADS